MALLSRMSLVPGRIQVNQDPLVIFGDKLSTLCHINKEDVLKWMESQKSQA